jgi:glutamate 5-kinase
LVLDAGAQRAIEEQGRSLLAVGVVRVEGAFRKGDVVALCREDGSELARGLINYTAEEMFRIAGQTTDQISETLGHRPYDEVIHRDNLTLVK